MNALVLVFLMYMPIMSMEQAVIEMPKTVKTKKVRKSMRLQYESFDPKTQEYKISKKILDNYFMQQNQKIEDNLIPNMAAKIKASKLSDSDPEKIDFDDSDVSEEINKIVIDALQDAFTKREEQVNALSAAMDGKWDKKQVVVASSIVGGIATIISSAVALIVHFTSK